MTTTVEQVRTVSATQLRREAVRAARAAARKTFPPRPVIADWPMTGLDRDATLEMLAGPPFASHHPGSERGRLRGVKLAVAWLADQPGLTWQQRWLASGAEAAGPGWKTTCCVPWLDDHDVTVVQRLDLVSIGLISMICADLVRPSVCWLAAKGVSSWAMARNLQAARDPAGFARLHAACCDDHQVTASARRAVVGRAGLLVAARGGTLAEVTPGDLLELFDVEAEVAGRPGDYSAVTWRLLHGLGGFGPDAPAVLAELRTVGQRNPAQLIDRYQLTCRPVRDLLVDYLNERQPALDHNSLETLSQQLGRLFWQDIERHHPDVHTLNLPAQVAAAWKQRLRTKTTVRTGTLGDTVVADAPRLTRRHTLAAVRALYLDLAQWALEDPARWAPWVSPCPVTKADINSRKETRHRKSRMDARTRERLPLLPALLSSAAQRHRTAVHLLAAARAAEPGNTFTAHGHTLTRVATRTPTEKVWAEDPITGKRRDLIWEEDHTFWAWATVEVLRSTGVRVEELLELSHHSLVQYRLPSTGEQIPLLQIAPSKTDTERLLVVSPDLAEVLSAVIQRLQQPTGSIPLIAAYDANEHHWLPPAPLLFQRRVGTEHRPISTGTIRNLLDAALTHAGLRDATGEPLRYTPHDFRRLFITDAILTGLPPHIAQVIVGHRDINVTLGYKAVYPDEVLHAHRAFLARRRSLRPTEECV
jgi:hypothetical protein